MKMNAMNAMEKSTTGKIEAHWHKGYYASKSMGILYWCSKETCSPGEVVGFEDIFVDEWQPYEEPQIPPKRYTVGASCAAINTKKCERCKEIEKTPDTATLTSRVSRLLRPAHRVTEEGDWEDVVRRAILQHLTKFHSCECENDWRTE